MSAGNSFFWIRWRKVALKGMNYSRWHATRIGDKRTYCGIVKPLNHPEPNVQTQDTISNEPEIDLCPVCVKVGLQPR